MQITAWKEKKYEPVVKQILAFYLNVILQVLNEILFLVLVFKEKPLGFLYHEILNCVLKESFEFSLILLHHHSMKLIDGIFINLYFDFVVFFLA
jgi:hypothetical protein